MVVFRKTMPGPRECMHYYSPQAVHVRVRANSARIGLIVTAMGDGDATDDTAASR
jgi:hypothetical protein